jgi:hypothetical protein
MAGSPTLSDREMLFRIDGKLDEALAANNRDHATLFGEVGNIQKRCVAQHGQPGIYRAEPSGDSPGGHVVKVNSGHIVDSALRHPLQAGLLGLLVLWITMLAGNWVVRVFVPERQPDAIAATDDVRKQIVELARMVRAMETEKTTTEARRQ